MESRRRPRWDVRLVAEEMLTNVVSYPREGSVNILVLMMHVGSTV
jgi:hypothetical protein